jgi:hypothetical protein
MIAPTDNNFVQETPAHSATYDELVIVFAESERLETEEGATPPP